MKKLLLATLLLLLFVAPLYARTVYESKRKLEESRALWSAQHHIEAIDAYRTAISWRAPLNPYPKIALKELSALAFSQLPETERREALNQLIRGVQSSRNFLSGLDSEANVLLERSRHELELLAGVTPETPRLHELFPPKTNFLGQVLSQLFFWLWLGTISWTIMRGFSRDGSMLRGPLLRGVACSGVFYTIWLVCLSIA